MRRYVQSDLSLHVVPVVGQAVLNKLRVRSRTHLQHVEREDENTSFVCVRAKQPFITAAHQCTHAH